MEGWVDEHNIERDGERAAREHHPWYSNPFLQRENMPMATGETLREWSRKHDAWQRGFEAHGSSVKRSPGDLS